MLLQTAGFLYLEASFLRLNNIPLYEYTTVSLSIHLSMDALVVSVSGLM